MNASGGSGGAVNTCKSAWQDIATAPKDGTRVLVFNIVAGVYTSGYCDNQWPLNVWGGRAGNWYPMPSHWQPLPEPPPETER